MTQSPVNPYEPPQAPQAEVPAVGPARHRQRPLGVALVAAYLGVVNFGLLVRLAWTGQSIAGRPLWFLAASLVLWNGRQRGWWLTLILIFTEIIEVLVWSGTLLLSIGTAPWAGSWNWWLATWIRVIIGLLIARYLFQPHASAFFGLQPTARDKAALIVAGALLAVASNLVSWLIREI